MRARGPGRSIRLAALSAGLLVAACGGCETPRPVPPVSPDVVAAADVPPPRPPDAVPARPTVAYAWACEPEQLMVFRDTLVHLHVAAPDLSPASYVCQWDFGDGDTGAGCDVRHVFRGGLTDGWVTLTLIDGSGAPLATEKRKLALERLPVVPLPAEGEAGTAVEAAAEVLPEKPLADDARRLVIVGPVHGTERLAALVSALSSRVHPDLVVHTGDLLPIFSEEGFAGWMQSFLTPLAAASIPLAVAAGEVDVATPVARSVFSSTMTQILFKPVLDFQDERGYPFRYSFLFGGTYVIVLDTTTGDLSDEQFRWLKAELTRGAGYPRILVVSHLPPAPLTATSTAALKRAYKVQELLLRYRGTLLVTGHEPVFYDGRFAQVHVVSSGGGVDDCRPFAGDAICQGTAFTVIDLVGQEPPRVFGVSGANLDRPIAHGDLPAKVDRYEREPR